MKRFHVTSSHKLILLLTDCCSWWFST